MIKSFSKYQALGNNFIVLDEICVHGKSRKFENLARDICDPTHGIGADGLLVLSGEPGVYRVDIYNADGSWAEKSGNGSRIAAMYLTNSGLISGNSLDLITGSGQSQIKLYAGNEQKRVISASLGVPDFNTKKIPVASDKKFFISQTIHCFNRAYITSAVSVGNPHLILFCDDFDFDWQTIGSELESHPMFPNRVNVGFVKVIDDKNIDIRDFERGVGPTDSSGTGAAAAVAISVMRGFTDRKVSVHSQAGILRVYWDSKSDELSIKGPIEFIFSGEYDT
ncbi:MAG: diaminopimelate epimerase [candidate division Zixibacteria bacterium]